MMDFYKKCRNPLQAGPMLETPSQKRPGRRPQGGRKRFSWKRGERGQALVEFSLVSLLFFVLVFGVIDFGMGMHTWITVTNASREGARVGAVHADSDGSTDCNPLPDSGTIERKVCDVAGSLNGDNISISVTGADPDGDNTGDPVTVEVGYTYNLVTPLGAVVNFDSLDFAATSEMRLE
jgi:Flp pilus assembly protein TadG